MNIKNLPETFAELRDKSSLEPILTFSAEYYYKKSINDKEWITETECGIGLNELYLIALNVQAFIEKQGYFFGGIEFTPHINF